MDQRFQVAAPLCLLLGLGGVSMAGEPTIAIPELTVLDAPGPPTNAYGQDQRERIREAEEQYLQALSELALALEAHEQAGFLGLWLKLGSTFMPDPNLRPGQERSLALAVAANGGGYRSANFTYGVMLGLDSLIMDGGRSVLDEVDMLSTVSGGSIPTARHAWYARHPEQEQVVADDLRAMRTSLTLTTLLRDGELRARRYAAAIAIPDFATLPLDAMQDGKGPLWVPNASVVPTGARLPLARYTLRQLDVKKGELGISAALALAITSSVPGAARSVRLGARVEDDTDPTEQRLFDGAWGERWGLLTAMDTLLQMGAGTEAPPPRRVAIAIDTRPQFQLNTIAGMGVPELADKLSQRAVAIGTGFEIARYRADEWFLEHVFARPVRYPHPRELTEAQWQTLRQESFAIDRLHPMIAPLSSERRVARDIDEDPKTISLLRLGADRLLAQGGWDEADRIDACERTAARLFTVVAMQPTDLELAGPAFHPEGLEQRAYVYPYGKQRSAILERQALLIAAGVLTALLHEEAIEQALGRELSLSHQQCLEGFFTTDAPLPWRNRAEAEDWTRCTGLGHGPINAEEPVPPAYAP